MLRTMVYRPGSNELSVGGEDLIRAWKGDPRAILWVDLADHDPGDEKRLMIDTLGLHPMAVQDAQRDRHPPKLERFGDHVFILLKGLGPDASGFEFSTIQLSIFVGERFFVTRRSGASLSTDRLWSELETDPAPLGRGTGAPALRLSRLLVDRYLHRLLRLEPRLDELEQEMLVDPQDAMLSELTRYKTTLRKFRRVFAYHVQVFAALRSTPLPGEAADQMHEINDVFEQQERAKSLADLYYELASDLIEGYISLASHRLNHIIKILTIVTAIFVPLSFLAGVYGMNFEYMPELHSRAGYFVLLGVMGGVAALLLALFRVKRWL